MNAISHLVNDSLTTLPRNRQRYTERWYNCWVARRSDQVGYESTRCVPETSEVRYIYITHDITSPSKVRPKA